MSEKKHVVEKCDLERCLDAWNVKLKANLWMNMVQDTDGDAVTPARKFVNECFAQLCGSTEGGASSRCWTQHIDEEKIEDEGGVIFVQGKVKNFAAGRLLQLCSEQMCSRILEEEKWVLTSYIPQEIQRLSPTERLSPEMCDVRREKIRRLNTWGKFCVGLVAHRIQQKVVDLLIDFCMWWPMALPPCLKSKIDDVGNTWLHLAAQLDRLDLCQLLVRSGMQVKLANNHGVAALELAASRNNYSVALFLESRSNMVQVRGGNGDAMGVAVEDGREITKLEWFTIPLAGFVKYLGGCHSFLKVTVSVNHVEAEAYVIEKAASSQAQVERVDGQFEHGVYISRWVDVAPLVAAEAEHVLEGPQLQNRTGCAAFTMRSLRAVAVSMGPYDVGKRNCHHAAHRMFNACAKAAHEQPSMPNWVLSETAKVLKWLSLDPTESRSQSQVQSYKASVEEFPHLCEDPRATDHTYARICVFLSAWVYTIARSQMVGFHNKTNAIKVVYIERIYKEIRLAPYGRVQLPIPERRSLVRINYVGLMNKTSRRTRLCTPEVWAGTNYSIHLTADGKVECAPEGTGLPGKLHVEHEHLSGGDRSVQWAIVSSSDTLYVVFRGTQNVIDGIVDLGFLTFDAAPHGLRIHGCMWVALTNGVQNETHVFNVIRRELAGAGGARRIVLCGHSLGGGYAILTALHLLHEGVDVASVAVFGAPQVVVPKRGDALWGRLNGVTAAYINSWDPVPRLPGCLNWVFQGLPKIPQGSFGPFVVKLDLSRQVEEMLGGQMELLDGYDVVGTTIVIHAGTWKILNLSHALSDSRVMDSPKAILNSLPGNMGPWVLDCHSIASYKIIIDRLTEPSDLGMPA